MVDEKFGLGPLLGHAFHLGRERMDARVSQYQVTPAQTHTLLYLHKHGGEAPQQAVTAFLRVKPSTANGILDRLEKKGLAERSVSSSDARHRSITMTDRGKQVQAAVEQHFKETEAAMVRGFTPEETAQLHSLLRRVIQNLEEDRDL